MGRGPAGMFNGISILFLVLSLIVVVFVVIQMASPAPASQTVAVVVPTQLLLPTSTPTETPRPTLPPTFTSTPSNTPTATSSPTATITVPPSATITDTPGPSLTPSETPTPSISPTPEASATSDQPTFTPPPTVLPYYFDLNGQVQFVPNTTNSAGCAYQAIVGSVLDRNGLDVTRQFNVRVFGSGIEQIVLTGSNTQFGTTGWEVPVSTQVNASSYFVRLETTLGTPISRDIQVTFAADCNLNVATVRFAQIADFGGPPVAGATPEGGLPFPPGGGGSVPPGGNVPPTQTGGGTSPFPPSTPPGG